MVASDSPSYSSFTEWTELSIKIEVYEYPYISCAVGKYLSAGWSCPPYPPLNNFPEMVTLNRDYVLQASEVLSLHAAL